MIRLSQWKAIVWTKVMRNIKQVISYGGTFELNSAAFRKGFIEPYPTSEIAAVLLSISSLSQRLIGKLNFTPGPEVCAFG